MLQQAGGEVVLVERDEERADAIRKERMSGLELIPGDAWLMDRSEFGAFDLIYAPNLLNQVADPVAKRCLARLASMLRRQGRMILTTYSPEVADTEYPIRHSFLRAEERVARLSDHIADACFAGQVIWRDETEMLVFLEIHR